MRSLLLIVCLTAVSNVSADYQLVLSGYASIRIEQPSTDIVVPVQKLGGLALFNKDSPATTIFIDITENMLSRGWISKVEISDQLEKWNRSHPNFNIRVSGADTVRLYTYTAVVSYELLFNVAKSELEKSLEKVGFASFDIEPLSKKQGDVLLRTAANEFRVRPITIEYPFDHICIWVDIKSLGQVLKSVPIWLRIKANKDVLVANSRVDLGRKDSDIYFRLENVNVANLSSAPLENEKELFNKETKKVLLAGNVITKDHLRPIPIVKQGDMVTIETISGKVYLASSAIAVEEGQVGNQIKLKSVSSGEFMKGIVLPNGRVFIKGIR